MSWEIIKTAEFGELYEKLPSEIKSRFEKQLRKVKENPYSLGKTLGYPWFRELKNDKFRAYYLIYDKQIAVLFVGVSNKKSQQTTINTIKNNFVAFKFFIENQGKEFK